MSHFDSNTGSSRRAFCRTLGVGVGLLGATSIAGLAQAAPPKIKLPPKKSPAAPKFKFVHPLRKKALTLLDELLPAPVGSKNYRDNPWANTPLVPGVKPAFTNCNSFPPHYLMRLNDGKPVVGMIWPVPEILKNLSGFMAAWRPADGKARPQPGDIYMLYNSPKRDGTIGHVGVIKSSTGSTWTTGDYGQNNSDGVSDGWDGMFIQRSYSVVDGIDRLSGPNGTNPRAIWGWLDLPAIPAFK
jgi:hypothetical protein